MKNVVGFPMFSTTYVVTIESMHPHQIIAEVLVLQTFMSIEMMGDIGCGGVWLTMVGNALAKHM